MRCFRGVFAGCRVRFGSWCGKVLARWGSRTRRKSANPSVPLPWRRLQIENVECRILLSGGPAADVWIGGQSGDWGDPDNWLTGVPTGNDDTIFLRNANTVDVPDSASSGSAQASAVNFQGDCATLQGGAGDSLAVSSGQITVASGVGVAAVSLGGSTLMQNGLTEQGDGTLILSAVNTYAGPTTVDSGTLIATRSGAIPDNQALLVGAGGTFIFDPTTTIPQPTFQRAWPSSFGHMEEPAVSPAGVVYASGGGIVSGEDLGSGTTRLYDSLAVGSNGGTGSGWMLANQAFVVGSGDLSA